MLDKDIASTPELIAVIKGDPSGIVMEISTTEPGIQFYGGNFMQSINTFKNGKRMISEPLFVWKRSIFQIRQINTHFRQQY